MRAGTSCCLTDPLIAVLAGQPLLDGNRARRRVSSGQLSAHRSGFGGTQRGVLRRVGAEVFVRAFLTWTARVGSRSAPACMNEAYACAVRSGPPGQGRSAGSMC